MVDQDTTALPGGAAPLPTQPVSTFSLLSNVSEILLTVGVTRIFMQNSADGPSPHPVTEWLVTLSMSPQAAVLAADLLRTGIEQYEATNGAIPRDPNVKMQSLR